MSNRDEVNQQSSGTSGEPFDLGVTREEAEDWLNDIPLFEDEKET
jgi:phenylacetate-coenzyme A ligase PaaK-like adenylate-forming protein